jgi:hypothetical protein
VELVVALAKGNAFNYLKAFFIAGFSLRSD